MRARPPVLVALGAAVAAVAVALTGCAGSPAPSASGGRIAVVASTDVWGDVVQQVGGDAVQVTSIIDDPSRDPHDYEATARDRLAVARARLVVENGGGYDDFMSRLTSGDPGAVLDAAAHSGLPGRDSSDFNEHIWYSIPAVGRIATAIAGRLERLDPAAKPAITRRAAAFAAQLRALERQEADIRRTADGEGVAITEPVPLYMTAALGLVDRTPPAFSHAVEEGSDVAPAVLQQELALLSGHRVAVLAPNLQTETTTTDRVTAAARAAGVPVVGVRETLPEHQGYLTWMRSDLDAFASALRS